MTNKLFKCDNCKKAVKKTKSILYKTKSFNFTMHLCYSDFKWLQDHNLIEQWADEWNDLSGNLVEKYKKERDLKDKK